MANVVLALLGLIGLILVLLYALAARLIEVTAARKLPIKLFRWTLVPPPPDRPGNDPGGQPEDAVARPRHWLVLVIGVALLLFGVCLAFYPFLVPNAHCRQWRIAIHLIGIFAAFLAAINLQNWPHVLRLIQKDFSVRRINPHNGRFVKKDPEGGYETEYSGLLTWFVQALEAIIAYVFAFFVIKNGVATYLATNGISMATRELWFAYLEVTLTTAAIVLFVDAVLHVCVLLAAPGIDEIVDTLALSVGGIFILLADHLKKELLTRAATQAEVVSIAGLAAVLMLVFIARGLIHKWNAHR